jgi:hypothetical protein
MNVILYILRVFNKHVQFWSKASRYLYYIRYGIHGSQAILGGRFAKMHASAARLNNLYFFLPLPIKFYFERNA